MNSKVKQVRTHSKDLATFILYPRATLLLVTADQKERGPCGREGSITTTMIHCGIVSFSCDIRSYFVGILSKFSGLAKAILIDFEFLCAIRFPRNLKTKLYTDK